MIDSKIKQYVFLACDIDYAMTYCRNKFNVGQFLLTSNENICDSKRHSTFRERFDVYAASANGYRIELINPLCNATAGVGETKQLTLITFTTSLKPLGYLASAECVSEHEINKRIHVLEQAISRMNLPHKALGRTAEMKC